MEQNYTIENQRLLFLPQHEYNKTKKRAEKTTTLPQHRGEVGSGQVGKLARGKGQIGKGQVGKGQVGKLARGNSHLLRILHFEVV